MDTTAPLEPNHHAHYPSFAGIGGLAAGLSMVVGRREICRFAADATGVAAGDVLVDVGCGPGAALREALRRGAHVIGVDPAPVMLRLGRSLTRRTSDAEWREGVAESLPVSDGAATVLWALSTVHHWQDVGTGLGEARRVLAPEGRVLAIERRTRPGAHGHASHGWTDAQAQSFADAVRAAGFTDVRGDIVEFGGHEFCVVQATRP